MTSLASVRARTTLAASLLVALTLVLAGVVFFSILRRTLFDNLDDALAVRSADLTALVRAGVTPTEIAITDEGDAVAQIILNNRVVASSANVEQQLPLGAEQPGYFTAVGRLANEDVDFRLLVSELQVPAGDVQLVVGASLEDVQRTLSVASRSLLVGLPMLAILAGVGAWFIVGRALRPVDQMRADLARISASDLHQRVAQPTTDDEIRMLADTMNSMLTRLERGTAAQREFVGAASHELRTPITIIRHKLEIATTSGSPDWERVSEGVLSEVLRMQRLVDNLLVLARRDEAPSYRAQRERWPLVDLDDLVVDESRHLNDGPLVDLSGVSAGQVRSDPDDLRRIVRNLIDNAVRHATSNVEIRLASGDGHVTLEVDDDGPGVAEQDRIRVFERFVRADDARSRSHGGAGLGLAIVRDLVTDLGGKVAVTKSSTLGGSSFVVSLPDARQSTPSSPATTRFARHGDDETKLVVVDPIVLDDE